VMGNAHS